MPEGDTILRAAQTLDRWLGGREITAARSTVPRVQGSQLVGRTVLRVEAQAKHLLIRFGPLPAGGREVTLRTHQRMEGSWHVASAGAAWRRPAHQARVVLEAGDRVAVCFNSPVVELFPTRETVVHPVLRHLGPDVLAGPIPPGAVWARASELLEPDVLLGELPLDQRVVSGIGNIWRAESLFVCRLDPWQSWPAAGAEALDRLAATAGQLMAARVPAAGPARHSVYGRHGRPCRRCGTAIRSARLGRQARTVWWCPTCQAALGG